MRLRRSRGFTLIEVVVAFVLLTLVLATSFEIFSTGFARAALLEDESRALLIAQSRLATAGVEENLKEGETRGESEDRRFQWTLSVKRSDEGTEPGKPAPSVYQLYRIDVVVAWQGADDRHRQLALSTLGLWTRA
ncbi:MAG TPA: prepilin-type N-terminal cleavage/methylation domain-containing protein [Usitatibacter sp.]